jgi:glycosyltransferase involved in cell wall biosynthesis
MYADTLKDQSGGQLSLSILSFSKCRIPSKEISGNLVLYRIPINPIYALITFRKLFKSINEISQVKLLVAGDPWESLILARMVRMGLKAKAKIQVQVHGDIGNRKWIHANVRNWLRSRITFFTLRLADQVRSVSETQSQNLVDTYKVSNSVLVIVPVPSIFPAVDLFKESHVSRPKTLGFVGRIQNDRGLSLFIELISKLASGELDLSLVIVGDGDKREEFLAKLEAIVGTGRVTFLGHLTKEEMLECWKRIGILVSTAPSESFGRTLRESLVNGVPVWAVPSSGVRDLMKQVEGNEVQLMDNSLALDKLIHDYKELLKSTVSPETKKFLRELDHKSVSELMNSWMTLCIH